MSRAAAWDGKALPNDPHAYFHSPEFHARMLNVNDAMQRGMAPKQSDFPEILGCTQEDFSAYLATVTDENGLSLVDVGRGGYITLDMGTDDALQRVLNILHGDDDAEVVRVTVTRLLFLRRFCDMHSKLAGMSADHFALNGILLTFTIDEGAVNFRVDTADKPRQQLMVGYCTVRDGKLTGEVNIIEWIGGWEDRLF